MGQDGEAGRLDVHGVVVDIHGNCHDVPFPFLPVPVRHPA
jgi:hypothetical protein